MLVQMSKLCYVMPFYVNIGPVAFKVSFIVWQMLPTFVLGTYLR